MMNHPEDQGVIENLADTAAMGLAILVQIPLEVIDTVGEVLQTGIETTGDVVEKTTDAAERFALAPFVFGVAALALVVWGGTSIATSDAVQRSVRDLVGVVPWV